MSKIPDKTLTCAHEIGRCLGHCEIEKIKKKVKK